MALPCSQNQLSHRQIPHSTANRQFFVEESFQVPLSLFPPSRPNRSDKLWQDLGTTLSNGADHDVLLDCSPVT